jgi:hypothetical protein
MNLAKGDGSSDGVQNGSGSINRDQARTKDERGRGREPPRSTATRMKNWARERSKSIFAGAGKRSSSQIKRQKQVIISGVRASSASKVPKEQLQTSASSPNSGNERPVATCIPDPKPENLRLTPKSCLEVAIEWMQTNHPGYHPATDVNHAEIQKSISTKIENLEKGQTRTKNVVQNTIRYILVFKGLANSITAFDPTKGSRIAVGGLYGILEASRMFHTFGASVY